MKSEVDRRTFQRTGLAAAAATFTAGAPAPARVLGAAERLRLGFIGVGNRGCQMLSGFLAHADAEPVVLCDVYAPYLHADYDKVDPRFRNLGGRIPKMAELPASVRRVKDFRRVLDAKDVDAVVIATPDHWHALQTIEACRAGKDVYCEKPVSVTIKEGRAMVEAARKHDRIVQVGTHRRSSRLYAEAVELVRGGALGKITVARAAYASNMAPRGIGLAPDSAPPEDLDWDLWLGPRPMRPFNENVMPYKFRWHHHYSSQIANWGVHYFDAIRWLTGELAPTRVAALGGRFAVEDARTIPDTAEMIFEHASGMLTVFSLHEATSGPKLAEGAEVELYGTLGTMFISSRGYRIVPERGGQFQDPAPRRKPLEGRSKLKSELLLDQWAARDFLDNVKSRTRPLADIEEGHRSTTFAHLANIAHTTRRVLDWDPQAERITNDPAADTTLDYEYRKPWTLG
ncbi:MAG: Gfo/Idh/MocA family oxidoreductase [Isosphaeraceae bacterium]|nr:Gfo/Idh/MocA family oxidoreductase [Isosphaeraceae bacterium]